jgi:hypothetical protein
MPTALRLETTVLPGNRVEVYAPQSPEGARVEVTVVLAEQSMPPKMAMIDLVKTLPPGPRAFDTWEEYERFLEEEKNSWE